jgi:signal transduction histidine kinase
MASLLIAIIFIVLNGALGIFVLAKNPRSAIHRLYAWMAGFAVLWTAATYFYTRPDLVTIAGATLLERLSFVMAAFFCFAWLRFCIFFREVHEPALRTRFSTQIMPAVLASAIAATGAVARYMQRGDDVVRFELGPFFFLYVIILLGYLIGGFLIVAKKYQGYTGLPRIQTFYVLVGFTLTITNAVLVNILGQGLFGLTFPVILFGIYGLTVLLAATAYAVIQHRFLNVQVIASELFAAILIAVLAADIALSRSFGEFVFRVSTFVASAIFGVLLVRSVIVAVEGKEENLALVDELTRANRELRDVSDAKSTLVLIATHQLRGPVAAIRGYVSMLAEGDFGVLPRGVQTVIEQIFRISERFVTLTDVFLDVSRLEAGQLRLERSEARIEDLVNSAIAEFQPELRVKKDIRIRTEFPEPPAPALFIDRGKIYNVIFNLLDNAIKYTERGTVLIRAAVEDGWLTVSVKDTGIGIAKNEAPALFEKFVRGDGGLLLHPNGAGLGLYVIKMFVEAHGGSVWVASDGLGAGSEFGFRLPIGA